MGRRFPASALTLENVMIANYKTENGFRLSVFSTVYMDWGLRIDHGGETVFYSPHCLSNESYGRKPAPRFNGDWDAAEEWELNATPKQQAATPAWVEWTSKDWHECLEAEADTFIEAYVGNGGEA